jgi:superfamily II DNA or RNA helicase
LNEQLQVNDEDLTYITFWKQIVTGSSKDLTEINRLISDYDQKLNTPFHGEIVKGVTHLHMFMLAVINGRQEALALLHKVIDKENLPWNTKLLEGRLQGLTPLCLLMKSMVKGFPETFDVLAKIINNNTLDWNAQVTEGSLKGCTPLYFLIQAAAKYPSCWQALIKLLSIQPLSELNFDVTDANGVSAISLLDEKRKNTFIILKYLKKDPQNQYVTNLHKTIFYAALGSPEALASLEKLDNDTLEWNAPINYGVYTGVTPLHLLILMIDILGPGYNTAGALLDKISIYKSLDWNMQFLTGKMKGSTPLHMLLTQVNKRNPVATAVLNKIADRRDLDWNIPIIGGNNLGTTPFQILLSQVESGIPEALVALAKIVSNDDFDWNVPMSIGPKKGQTPLYLLIVLSGSHQACWNALIKLIKIRPRAELNFDVTDANGNSANSLLDAQQKKTLHALISSKKDVHIRSKIMSYLGIKYYSINSLHKLMKKAQADEPGALALLEEIQEFSPIDWNVQIARGEASGSTPLHILLDIANNGNNIAIRLLNKIANNKTLKWNVPLLAGKKIGLTPLHSLIELMNNPNPSVLKILSKVISNAELNWNAQITTGSNIGLTPFHMLLLLVSKGNALAIDMLDKLVTKDDFNWNERIEIGINEGRTHLFMLIEMASRDFVCWQALEKLIARRPLAELNFDVTDANGNNVKSLLDEEKQVSLASWINLKKATHFDGSKINGGVAHKYQTHGALPKLPHPTTGEEKKIIYTNKIPFFTLFDKNTKTQTAITPKDAHLIDVDGFNATLLSTKGQLTPDEQIIFIFAGRKENALLPRSKLTRCVLVLTVDEYQELENKIPSNVDVLVLENITSASHGCFDRLHLLTARRVGVFLTAHHLQLNHFLMIDDNIKHVQFQSNNVSDGTDQFYALLKQQVKDKGCVNVSTLSYKEKREGELGSKLFFVNMELIRQKLPLLKDMFLLFPGADETLKPLEDYYFQTFLHVMLHPLIGYQILDKELTTLIRSRAHLNACKSSGMLASNFEGPKQTEIFNAEQQDWLKQTLNIINRIISDNAKKYEGQQSRINTANLGVELARAHGVDIYQSTQQVNLHQRVGSFVQAYQNDLREWQDTDGTLYPYQKRAIEAVAMQKKLQSCIEIPTGCGKSMLLYMLASLGFSQLNKDEIIAVVTPQIGIANQLYDSFINYHAKLNEQRFPVDKILLISSDAQSISINLLKCNSDFDSKNHIAIFCLESFEKFCKAFPDRVARTRLVLLDESHKQKSIIGKLDDFNFQDALVIGSSATPLKNTVLGAPIYRYTFKEAIENGYLAPIIADSLGDDYSKENVNHLINCLPLIFKNQIHPGYKETTSLASNKGMVFLPSIKQCKAAAAKLEEAKIPYFIINIANTEWKKHLETFVSSKEAGIILAVRMLEFGFNCPKLSHLIIAKKISNIRQLKQLIGRPVRNDIGKVAYVLTFEDIKKKIDRLFKNIPHTRPACSDYLAQDNSYYFCKDKKEWLVCDTALLPTNACATFTIEPSDDYSDRQNLHKPKPIVEDSDSSDIDYSSDDSDFDFEDESDIELIFKPRQAFIVSETHQASIKHRTLDAENQSENKPVYQKKARML